LGRPPILAGAGAGAVLLLPRCCCCRCWCCCCCFHAAAVAASTAAASTAAAAAAATAAAAAAAAAASNAAASTAAAAALAALYRHRKRTWVEVRVAHVHLRGLNQQGVVVGDALDVAGQHVVGEELHAQRAGCCVPLPSSRSATAH